MRVTAVGNPQPYQFFGTFAGLSFWPGGLSLLAAAPGVGKTSWLLRMAFEAARQGFPAALGCYEHTSEELKYRLHLQCEAVASGAHSLPSRTGVPPLFAARTVSPEGHSLSPAPEQVEALLAQGGQAVLLALSDQDDTVRAKVVAPSATIEETLIQDYNFPVRGPALLAMDYLQHPSALEIAGTERGLKLRLYAAPGCAQGAAQSWAAMTNQQTRWQKVECPPQSGAWRVLKTHARVPSLAVSPSDAFLAVGGQLLGESRMGRKQPCASGCWARMTVCTVRAANTVTTNAPRGTPVRDGRNACAPWPLTPKVVAFSATMARKAA